jgi:Flp pilus assembly protein TadG
LARRIRDDRRGVAALEFAIVGTMLLAATLGFFETVLVVRAKTLLTSAVANMADLVAAGSGIPPITQLTLRDYCKGVQLTMVPYTTTSLAMAVASVTHATGSGGTAADWEYDGACPTTAAALGSNGATTLASPMVPSGGDSVIVIQASYTYTPVVSTILSSVTLKQTVYSRPRYGSVKCLGC